MASPDATKLLTVVGFHAGLGTMRLMMHTSALPNQQPAQQQQDEQPQRPRPTANNSLVACVHLWCATVGFLWWYADAAQGHSHSAGGGPWWLRAG